MHSNINRIRFVLMASLLVLSVFLVSCKPEATVVEPPAAAEPTQAPPPTEMPAAEATQPPPTEEPAAIETTLDGKALVEARCAGCHSLDRVYSAKYDQAGWEINIARMVTKGAVMSDEEAQVVIEYLLSLQ